MNPDKRIFSPRAARSHPQYAVEADRAMADRYILPTFGDTDIADLTTEQFEKWRNSLVTVTDDPEIKRRSKYSANRLRTLFVAALNQAYKNGKVKFKVWDLVPPFKHVDLPRKRALTIEEAIKVINACQPDFRALVRGSLYTGARLGELRRLTVEDFQDSRININNGKGGRSRSVPMNAEGIAFFRSVATDRARSC